MLGDDKWKAALKAQLLDEIELLKGRAREAESHGEQFIAQEIRRAIDYIKDVNGL